MSTSSAIVLVSLASAGSPGEAVRIGERVWAAVADAGQDAGAPSDAGSGSEAGVRCANQLRLLGIEESSESTACEQLAVRLYGDYTERLIAGVANGSRPAVLQPLLNLGGSQGGASQSQAVPSVQPTAEAGASVAVAGSSTAQDLIVDIHINPLSWFVSPDAKAWASRAMDVSLLLPITAMSGDLSSLSNYWGLRLKANWLAGSAAQRLSEALKAAAERGTDINALNGELIRFLQTNGEIAGCVTAIRSGDTEKVTSVCGSDLSLGRLQRSDQAYREAMKATLKAVDSQYLGLDLRYDYGDPTFSGDPLKRARTFLGAVAGGYSPNWTGTDWYLQGRARIGFAHSLAPSLGTYSASIDWGIAAEVGVVHDPQRIKLSVGFEGRSHVGGTTDVGDTDYWLITAGLTVPIGDSAGLSLGAQIPLGGKRTPLITLSADWSLLAKLLSSS